MAEGTRSRRGADTWGPLLAALAWSALLVWLYGRLDPLAFAAADLKHYRAMAEAAPGLDLGRPQPFVYRVLGPWLAGVLPGPPDAGFYVLAVALSLGLVALVYALLRADGRDGRTAALGAALVAANPYLFGFNVFNPYQIGDLLAQFALGAGLLGLWRRRYAALGAVAALGVLAREPAVLLVPVAFVFLWERGRLREDGLRVALALVSALVLFVVPRLVLVPEGGPSLVHTFLNASGKAASAETWYRLLVNAAAPLTPLFLFFWRTGWGWARARLHLVVLYGLVLASAFFGGDQERLMQPAVWALYPALALVIARHLRGTGPAAVLLAAAFAASLHHLTARFPLPSRTLTVVLSLAALSAVTALALWAQARDARPQTRTPRSAG